MCLKPETFYDLIQNPYSIRITNAIAESMNNKIQTLIDLCYGIPKFENEEESFIYRREPKRLRILRSLAFLIIPIKCGMLFT